MEPVKSDNEIELQKQLLLFGKFVPHKILSLIRKQNVMDVQVGDQVELKLTILFLDIRNFTSFSETLTPHDNFAFINNFIKQLEPVIIAHHGIVDKYIGDAIMVLFPTSADDAVRCSIEIQRQVDEYNLGRNRAGYHPIRIGIGLNSGISILGTIGSENKMEGTVISDAVNLASRLESLTKEYGSKLLISEHTLYSLSDISSYQLRFIDRTLVKGKKHPQSIYDIFDNDEPGLKQRKIDNLKYFEDAVAHYHYKDIDTAFLLLEKYLIDVPEDQAARLYYERCNMYRQNGHHEGALELSEQIEWSIDYDIGVSAVDVQHRNLYRNVIKLSHCVDYDDGQDRIICIVHFIDKYVKEHFTTEEAIMQKYNYPFLQHQREQHAQFFRVFELLKKEITDKDLSRYYLKFRVQLLLIDWLINHTQREDRHFGRYLRFNNLL